MIAAATTEKTAMQMTVVNQNVNSIRSISSDADVGSQGMSTATTDAEDSREDAVDRNADNRAPAHRGEPTSRRNRSDAPNVCYLAPAFRGTRSTTTLSEEDEKWVLESASF